MRVWDRLAGWVQAEAESAQTYRRLADAAQLYAEGKSAMLTDPGLTIAENWRADNEPTLAWAKRHAPGFVATMQFLDDSVAERERQRGASEERELREREGERRRFEAEETAKRERAEHEAALAQSRAEAAEAFLAQSRVDAAIRLTQRTRKYLLASSIVALIAILLGIVAVSQNRALTASGNHALEIQSRFLARASGEAVDKGDAVTGVLLALEALPKKLAYPDRPFVNEAAVALGSAVANQQEIAVLHGHDGIVYSVAFSPDGKRIVSASADGTARMWDATSGAPIAVLRGHDDKVESASFSPDGKHIVSASADQTAHVWDATSDAPNRRPSRS